MQGPGWYADPGGKAGVFRWWDGGGWTRWLSRDASQPDPGPEPAVSAEPPPVALQVIDFPPPTGEPVGGDDQDLDETAPAPRRPRVLAGGILTAALLAVIAGGAVVSLNEDRMPSGPAIAPVDAAPPASLINYDPATGLVFVEELSYTVPGEPYSCAAAPAERAPEFRSWHSCFAFVHENYDPTGLDWVSRSNLGVLGDSITTPGDLERTTDDAFRKVVERDYSGVKITVRKRQEQPLDIGAPGRSRLITANLHYSIKDLPSKHDVIVFAVTRLESGAYAAWYATRTDDTPKSLREILISSAETLKARK